ncbi:unnamed protein product [Pleuronectes platessa]|uniref:Uncharacterized protein n=1 Tax=Pleuronectes platessa TaxID=8262 RepID=A0A9N7ZCY9_PLEPL|nr:unnamed protein product [Pleuronectes platessa]
MSLIEDIRLPTTNRLHYTVGMETMQELIPFAKEMLGQKPRRGLLKWMDAEMVQMLAREQRTVKAETQNNVGVQEEFIGSKHISAEPLTHPAAWLR